MTTYCNSCNRELDDNQEDDASPRQPCPNCGSTSRRFFLEAHAIARCTATAELSVTTYPQTLLSTAGDLLQRKQFGISVVVAHMACEVATERALSASFQAKEIDYLEEPVLGFLNGYNLAIDRNRKLYTALTDDVIQEQSFWQAFKESATRRNNIIHKGKTIGQPEAEASLTAAKAFVTHLGK